MFDRLVRLFPQHRAIVAQVATWKENYATAHADKLRIQDHNHWLTAELERTRQERDRWIEEALECNKMLANVGWQGRNSWVPWPESGRLPDEYMANEQPGPISTGHVRANEEARSQSAAVLEEYLNKGRHPELRRG